jgi:hypothetical protein
MNALRQSARDGAAYTLGGPQVAGPLAVFPVFGPEPRLEYRAFVQAAELGAFVKEVESGAMVTRLSVENPTDLPLLVYEGEEVLGAQQNRTFDASVLVAAGARTSLAVSCVERGRWDGRRFDERLAPSPQAADPGLRRAKRQAVNVRAAAGLTLCADQGEVWREVDSRLATHGIGSPSAALSDVYDGRRADLRSLTDAVRHVDGQVGAVAEVGGRPVALDLVSRADVFAALLPRLAQGDALEALGAGAGEPSERAAADFGAAALNAPRASQPTPGMGSAFGIVAPSVVGGGLVADGELVQLSAFPSEGKPDDPASGRIARPARRRPH